MIERLENTNSAQPAERVLRELQQYKDQTPDPFECLIRQGTFTEDFLRELADFPFEISLRDRGRNTILATGTEFEAIPGYAYDHEEGQELVNETQLASLIELRQSLLPIHTHPDGASYHVPSMQDIKPPTAPKSTNPPFELVLTSVGVIAFRRAPNRDWYEGISDEHARLKVEHEEIFLLAKQAEEDHNLHHPALAKVAKLELDLLERNHLVLADIPWGDPRIAYFIDICNKKRNPRIEEIPE